VFCVTWLHNKGIKIMFEQQKKVSVTSIVFAVVLLIIGIIIAFLVITSTGELLSDTETATGSDNFVYTTSHVLSGSNGVSTPSAQVYNQTWLNLVGNYTHVEYVYIPNSSKFNYTINDNFTLGIFFNTTKGYSLTYASLMSKQNYELIINSSNSSQFSITNGTKETQCKGSGVSFSDGVPHQFLGRYNGTHLSIFEDGTLIRNCVMGTTNVIYTNYNFSIGKESATTKRNFTGQLDNAFVNSSALTDLQIKNLYYAKNEPFHYSINLTSLSTPNINTSKYYKYNDTLSYMTNSTHVSVSIDGDKTWTVIHTLPAGKTPRALVKVKDALLVSYINFGNISVSIGNDTNWTDAIQPFVCQNATGLGYGTFQNDWEVAEDKWGAIYMGEYGGDDDNCAFVHKSTDRGKTWSIIYNQSRDMPEGGTLADHVHMVKIDPYTNYIYVAQGDGVPNSKLIRSVNNGTTWTLLQNGSLDYQYISMVFTPQYRIFGTDSSINKIVRTSDDVNFDTVYTLPSSANNYFWDMKRDNVTGYIITGTQIKVANTTTSILISLDNGSTWYSVQENVLGNGGLTAISNINSTGYGYLYYGAIFGDGDIVLQTFRFNLNNVKYKENSDLYLKLNENTGNVAYDSGGEGNNGIIVNGTWKNDGVLVSLRDNIDYVVDKYSGVFTLLNPVYQYSYIMTSWIQGTIINTYGNMKNNFTSGVDNISAKIPILFLVLMVVVIMGVIALLVIAFSALMKKSSGFGFLNRGI
jgi:hypothetical protein